MAVAWSPGQAADDSKVGTDFAHSTAMTSIAKAKSPRLMRLVPLLLLIAACELYDDGVSAPGTS
jgi:hypothetical protein